jgi:GT2 family glycosyltransferase
MAKPHFSMIVSNLNGMSLNLLKECLDSLLKPGYSSWELIVVDNNSDDDSVDYLEKRFRKYNNCHLVKNPINMYSQGLNLGAKKAKGKYLAYFNNDVALGKGYFQEIAKAFEKENNLGIAQGKLLNYRDRKKIDSAGETMDKYGNPVTIGMGEKDKGQFDNEEEILSASGSACVIKKDLFEKLGGYDYDYGIGYEDMDLALKARRLGYIVKRFPKAIVYHKRASTDLAPFVRVKVKWHFNKNRLITMIKNYPSSLLATTVPVTVILYLGIALYEWVVKNNWNFGWVRVTSLFWILTNLDRIEQKKKAFGRLKPHELGKNELDLFSSKSLKDIFTHFASIK